MAIKNIETDDKGRALDFITITNSAGLKAVLSNYGAHLISLHVPGAGWETLDVCLGYDDLTGYRKHRGYLGATVGRYCNRIGGSAFTLNGKDYALYPNDGANTLHGGKEGFDKKTWDYELSENGDSVTFSYRSPDGEEGYPGNLDVKVTYTLKDPCALEITYDAISDKDTVINLTNHSYFNLAGQGDIKKHTLQVHADSVTATTPDLIPTGVLLPVSGTPYDLRKPRLIGEVLEERGKNEMFDGARGFDINYVLKGEGRREAAVLALPETGLVMRVITDQPGVQVYSGQGLNNTGKGDVHYGPYSGIALETQHLPDSVHHPHFPDTRLKAGDHFKSTTIYQFEVQG
ncbi:MAG: galactose mutarotase [Clostridiales bacterium]|nr:galactose mutarotase [Clostridiales bacterium]